MNIFLLMFMSWIINLNEPPSELLIRSAFSRVQIVLSTVLREEMQRTIVSTNHRAVA
jgi:hypothetical protein